MKQPVETMTQALRRVRSLHNRATRRRLGQALIEGPQSLREALRWAPEYVRAAYLTEQAMQRHRDITQWVARANIPLTVVSEDVSAELSTDSQGVLGVLRTDRGPAAHDPHSFDFAGMRLIVVLAQASDPGNVGTIIRAADAAGADAVVLGRGSVDHVAPKVQRSAAGSFFHLPVVAGAEQPRVVAQLRAAGIQVLAADARGAHDLAELQDCAGSGGRVDLTRPTAWLMGNEAHGLSSQDASLADAAVRVPIYGKAESLNVSVAAALILYASARAQRQEVSA